jgi:hypothetical protein
VGEFLFVVVMFAGAFIVGHQLKQRELRKRKELARQLGLKFEQFFMGTVDDGKHGARDVPAAPVFRLLPFAVTCQLTGEISGVRVRVGNAASGRRGSGTPRRTSLDAYFRQPLALELHVMPQGLENPGRLMGENFIRTGDEAFDRRVLVQGRSESEIVPLLRDPEVQNIITDLFHVEGAPRVDDHGAHVELVSFANDPAKLRPLFDKLTRAVQVIEAARLRSTRFSSRP